MKRILSALVPAGFLSLVLALVPAASYAFTTKTGSTVSVAKADTTQGTLYAAGSNVTIDGNINGDLICGGSSVTVNGDVTGDVICAAQTIVINGTVGGNVRVAGQTVNLNGTVARNTTIFAQTLYVNSSAKLGGDLLVFAQTASVYGPIAGELYGGATTITLGSTVGGNVNLTVNELSFGSSAAIAGNLTYTSDKQLAIDKTKVAGTVTFKQATSSARHAKAFSWGAWIFGRIYAITAAYLVAFVLLWVAPRPLRRLTSTMLEKPLPTIGWGFLAGLAVPFALLFIAFTFIGLPLMVLGGMLWLIAMGLSGLIASVAFGRAILGWTKWNAKSLGWAIAVGIPVGFIAFGLPILGFFLGLVAIWWTFGGLALNAKYLRD